MTTQAERPNTISLSSAMMGFTLFACAILLSSVSAFEDKTIYQWLQDNGFNTLSSLLNSSGLAPVLSGSGPFTVFAPTDHAFSLLPDSQLNALKNNNVKLQAVLKYHVLSGFVLGPQITDGMSKQTLNGESLPFRKFGNGTTTVHGATISSVDQILNNGVVHAVDNVLLPSTSTLSEILLSRPNDFGDIILLLTITDLLPALSGTGPYTVFAPVNSAFEKIINQLPSFSSPNAMQIYAEIAKAHVVNGTFMSGNLKDGATFTTLHNNQISVSTAGGVTLGPSGAKVTVADLQGVNGVVHAIDTVMIPSDLASLGR